MHLISIIIPCYNSEKYIEECLVSVINQTYKNIEILCIDDCSKQNEYEIIKKYMDIDDRIVYIRHDKNYGLGGARNTGITHAHGEYIASIDSDDLMYNDLIETAYSATENGSIDVVVFSFETTDEKGNTIALSRLKQKEYKENNIDIFNAVNPAFWNKLWKKRLFDKIRFPPYVYYEDLATIPRLLYYAKTVKIIDNILYKYRKRSESITNTMSNKHIIDSISVASIIYKFLQRENIFETRKASFYKRMMQHINYVVSCSKKLLTKPNYRQCLESLIVIKTGMMNGINRVVEQNERIEKLILADENTVFQLTKEKESFEQQISMLSKDIEKLSLQKSELSKEKETLLKEKDILLSKLNNITIDNCKLNLQLKTNKKENDNLLRKISKLSNENNKLNKKILFLLNSTSYRIGRAFTFIPRKIKKLKQIYGKLFKSEKN